MVLYRKSQPIATKSTVSESLSWVELWLLVLYEALNCGERLKELLLSPNQVRAAGNNLLVHYDALIQFNFTSSRLITIPPGVLKVPLKMHGVMSYVVTCKPTVEEIDQYQSSAFQKYE